MSGKVLHILGCGTGELTGKGQGDRGDRETGGERQGERERETERQRDRERERETEREREKERERERERKRERERIKGRETLEIDCTEGLELQQSESEAGFQGLGFRLVGLMA